MFSELFMHVHYGAIIASVVVFFALGALWFSVLFNTSWVAELKNHNVVINDEPAREKMMSLMGLTLLNHVVVVLAMAYLVYWTNSQTVESGLRLGLVTAVGFTATAVAGVFLWENRSVKLFLIDVGYQMIGVILSAVILSVWRP